MLSGCSQTMWARSHVMGVTSIFGFFSTPSTQQTPDFTHSVGGPLLAQGGKLGSTDNHLIHFIVHTANVLIPFLKSGHLP